MLIHHPVVLGELHLSGTESVTFRGCWITLIKCILGNIRCELADALRYMMIVKPVFKLRSVLFLCKSHIDKTSHDIKVVSHN